MSTRRSIFKCLILGDKFQGKTEFRRFLGDNFEDRYDIASNAHHAVKRVYEGGEENVLQFWEITGNIGYVSIGDVYYDGVKGLILIFDLSNPESLDNIPNWIKEYLGDNKREIVPMALLGYKTAENRKIEFSLGQNYAAELSDWSNFEVPYVECNKAGIIQSTHGLENVDKLFLHLINQSN